MRTTNYTDLRNNLKHHLDSVVQDNTPLIVQRPNGESVVVISLEDYNALMKRNIYCRIQSMQNI